MLPCENREEVKDCFGFVRSEVVNGRLCKSRLTTVAIILELDSLGHRRLHQSLNFLLDASLLPTRDALPDTSDTTLRLDGSLPGPMTGPRGDGRRVGGAALIDGLGSGV